VADNDDHIARLAGHGPDDDDGYCCRDGCYARSDRPWRYAGICPVTHDEAEGLDLQHDRDTGRTEIARLLALVDEQAAEIERGRRALYRVMQACGIQGEATPETLAGMDVALCGEVGARNIADAWRLARERAAEIERLRGEVEAESRRADDAEQARDYETYYHARAKKKIERLEGQAAAAESRGAEGERAAVVAWLRSEDVERHGLAARIARGEHLPAPSSAPEEGARGDEGHAVPDGVAAWRCSSCGFWCTLIENANHHANRTGHAFTHDPGANGTRSRDGHYADMVAALLGVPRG
jgi:hypothetical protein